ncbi:MAG: hypothetical protein AVDCRST_MAG61-1750, partial [uncultured Friedmanniella sp.]
GDQHQGHRPAGLVAAARSARRRPGQRFGDRAGAGPLAGHGDGGAAVGAVGGRRPRLAAGADRRVQPGSARRPEHAAALLRRALGAAGRAGRAGLHRRLRDHARAGQRAGRRRPRDRGGAGARVPAGRRHRGGPQPAVPGGRHPGRPRGPAGRRGLRRVAGHPRPAGGADAARAPPGRTRHHRRRVGPQRRPRRRAGAAVADPGRQRRVPPTGAPARAGRGGLPDHHCPQL